MVLNTTKFDGKPPTVVPKETKSGKPSGASRIGFPLIALAAFALTAIGLACLIAPPAAAAEGINLTFVGPLFTSLFDAITSVFPSFSDFIDEGFPLLIKIIVYVAIISMIGLFLYFFREVIMKIISYIGLGGGGNK